MCGGGAGNETPFHPRMRKQLPVHKGTNTIREVRWCAIWTESSDTTQSMKCCFISKIQSVEAGVVFSLRRSISKVNCFPESWSLYVLLNLLDQQLRGLLGNASHIRSTLSWGNVRPVLSQDTSCFYQTLVPTHYRSVNRRCLLWIHLIKLGRTWA